MAAKVIMIQGTMSNSGKSFITAGLCRVFRQDGFSTAPFKSQNMALNSYITEDGLEIGRAQAMQAEAAGIKPTVDMNPILLKPTSNVGSQVIVNGEVLGNFKAIDYYRQKTRFIPDVKAAFKRLSDAYDVIVIEGAGSPAEINLRDNDIVNMGLAQMVDAPVLLVGDIDRGGVFAALYGTVKLLEPEEQARIKGLVVNKFRGDKTILEPGLRMIEEKTGIPVVGTIPMEQIDVDDEDSLSDRLTKVTVSNRLDRGGKVQAGTGLEKDAGFAGTANETGMTGAVGAGVVDVAVVRLPHISNFTDFSAFERIPGVSLRYVTEPGQLGMPDLLLLPGTKNTMDDMRWLRESGLEALICRLHEAQVPVIGICGGYQLLGKTLKDPDNVEHGGTMRGLGLLDAETVFATAKTRTRITGAFKTDVPLLGGKAGQTFEGYEIHMGQTVNLGGCLELTELFEPSNPSDSEGKAATASSDWNQAGRVRLDGLGSGDGLVFGTYLHGFFDNEAIVRGLVLPLAEKKGIDLEDYHFDLQAYKEAEYDKLADLMRRSFDMDKLYEIMGLERKEAGNLATENEDGLGNQ